MNWLLAKNVLLLTQLTGDWLSIAVSEGTVENHIDRLTFEPSDDLQSLSLTSVFYRLQG